jgi:hypothetical protein
MVGKKGKYYIGGQKYEINTEGELSADIGRRDPGVNAILV